MKKLKFKNYDSGFVRAYFRHDKTLYCVQPGIYLVPDLLVCSSDGEPSYPVKDELNYTFTNMPSDGNSWTIGEIIAKFNNCKSTGEIMRMMDAVFGDKAL